MCMVCSLLLLQGHLVTHCTYSSHFHHISTFVNSPMIHAPISQLHVLSIFHLHSHSELGALPNLATIQSLLPVMAESGERTTTLPPPKMKGFKLGPTFPPILRKLVEKIQSLQFTDMCELLPDNVTLLRYMNTLDNTGTLTNLPAYAHPRLQEVNSILSWINCFTMYIAVLAQKHSHLVQSQLAYMALLVAETRRNGGEGWHPYDTVFRQHAADDPTIDWSAIDHSLHSSTFG